MRDDTSIEGHVPREDSPLLKDDLQKTRNHLRITICAIALGSFLAAFDLTVVAAIYPTIGASFNALDQTSYIATAYLLANTALQPLYGRLSDIYGRRGCLLFANIVFLIGTVGCALAPNLGCLVLARGIAGIGGGGLNVIGVVILSDLVPIRERGIYQGIMNIVFGSGSALGAPLGGLLADTIGWRSSFAAQIPLIFVSLFMVYTFINIKAPAHVEGDSKLKRIDFAGSVTLVAAVSCLILGLNIGGNFRPWLSPVPVSLLVSSLVLIVLFVYVEARIAREPIMPMALMTSRTPALTAWSNFFSTAGYFILIFTLPLFYRAIMNFSAAEAGKRLIPGAVGGSIGSLGLGLLMNKIGRYYWLLIASAIILIGSTILNATLTQTSPLWQQFTYMIPGGLGYGGLLTTTLVALLSSINPKDMASATGTSYLFRSTGSIIGISASNSVLNALLTHRLSYLDTDVVLAIRRNINTIWDEKILDKMLRQRVLDTYVDCVHYVMYMAIGLTTIALIVGSFVKEYTLKKTAISEVEEED